MASEHDRQGFEAQLAERSDEDVVVTLALPANIFSAVEGWRTSMQLASTEDALRELVRLGLLGEIAKSYETLNAVKRTLD